MNKQNLTMIGYHKRKLLR